MNKDDKDFLQMIINDNFFNNTDKIGLICKYILEER